MRNIATIPFDTNFIRHYGLDYKSYVFTQSLIVHADSFEWLSRLDENSLHAIVTDPPYGVKEYESEQIMKMNNSNGGIWRLPPAFDGNTRAPLPRFTALNQKERKNVESFFNDWAKLAIRALRPGGHVILASNSFLSQLVFSAIANSGLEFRGEVIRLTRTMRGGDRPKNAEHEFPDVCTLARGCYEPWGVFRKPIPQKMTVADCLRIYQTGGLRRLEDGRPFCDVIYSERTSRLERTIAPHPSIKPQSFMRQIVRAALPLGEGVIADPFMGSGSTIAAAEVLGLQSVGVERHKDYFDMAANAIPTLRNVDIRSFESKEFEVESELHLV